MLGQTCAKTVQVFWDEPDQQTPWNLTPMQLAGLRKFFVGFPTLLAIGCLVITGCLEEGRPDECQGSEGTRRGTKASRTTAARLKHEPLPKSWLLGICNHASVLSNLLSSQA